MATIVWLLFVNLLLVYNANTTFFTPKQFQPPLASSSHHGNVYTAFNHEPQNEGYFYSKPEPPLPTCTPIEPVIVDCIDDPLYSSCQITATNENGTCLRDTECPVSERILNYLTPPICGYDNQIRLLCCPLLEPEDRARGRRPSGNTGEATEVREMPVPQGGGIISEQMCRRFYGRATRRRRDTFEPDRSKDHTYSIFYFSSNPINTFAPDPYLPSPSPQKKRTCTRITTTTPTPTTTPPEETPSGTATPYAAYADPTEPDEYPYMAAIGYPNGTGVLSFLCGGFLADRCHVITAAHCLVDNTPTHVRLGGVSLRDKTIQSIDLRIDPSGIIAHPNYNPLRQYNDIAVLRLTTCAPDNIRPACLWTEQFIPNQNLTALGYGETERGRSSDELLKVVLTVRENNFCQNIFGSTTSNRRRRGISDEQICAGRPLENAVNLYYDACGGDSGGPLGASQERMYSAILVPYVMGVIQSGVGCGITPAGIYARISSHLGWLESVIWPNNNSNQ